MYCTLNSSTVRNVLMQPERMKKEKGRPRGRWVNQIRKMCGKKLDERREEACWIGLHPTVDGKVLQMIVMMMNLWIFNFIITLF